MEGYVIGVSQKFLTGVIDVFSETPHGVSREHEAGLMFGAQN